LAAGAGPPSDLVSVVHVTDPHFGRADPAAIAALTEAIRSIGPDVVVAGGDLTQRARTGQFREARRFLDGLGAPWLAVPGNHDVPLYNLFLRVFGPLRGFHREITDERAPLFATAGVRVLGLDSTRRKVVGRLQPDRIAQIARLAGGDPADLRVLVTHHPLVRRPLDGAEAALAEAERAGVDVLLAGHHHHAHLTEGPILGVEGPSPSHCLEPVRGFFVVRGRAREVVTELWSWDGIQFAPGQARTFVRRNHQINRR
jgi:3',5'-cyclic AMP phosphodiesterase CpdA